METSKVSRQPADSLTTQACESFTDGPAHQSQCLGIATEGVRISVAPIERGTDAGDQDSVIVKPAVHVTDPPHSKAAPFESSSELIELVVACPLKGRPLLLEQGVVSDSIDEGPTHAAKPKE
jgi:hypothetical protein